MGRWISWILITLLPAIQSPHAAEVYSGDSHIGVLVGWEVNYLSVLSKKGYFVRIHHDGSLRQPPESANDGYMGGVFYEDEGCKGDAYFGLSRLEDYPAAEPILSMMVYDSENKRTYYMPAGQQPVTFNFLSYSKIQAGSSSCNPNQFPEIVSLPHGVKLKLNNEAVTGVPDGGFQGPITVFSNKK